jgi:hypothetical protein
MNVKYVQFPEACGNLKHETELSCITQYQMRYRVNHHEIYPIQSQLGMLPFESVLFHKLRGTVKFLKYGFIS